MLVETQKERDALRQRERRAKYKAAGHRDPNTLKYQYGITLDDLTQMKEKQEDACGICKKPFASQRDTVIDHCHATDKVRGLLCRKCNVGLGMFEDNTESLKNAVAYLHCW